MEAALPPPSMEAAPPPAPFIETALSIQLDGMPCVLCRLCGLAKGRVRPAKGAPVFSFCFMWKN